MMSYETDTFPSDEERELLGGDSKNETLYDYCEHTKNLIDIRACKRSYLIFCTCCGPCGFITDIVTLIPKCIVNNAKL